MNNKTNPGIKRAQRESLLYKEISQCMHIISMDDPCLQDIMVNRVQLSADKSVCTVLFFSSQGPAVFMKLLPRLTEYKATIRTALAKAIQSRYVPNIVFAYDAQFEKQIHIERLLDKIKVEDGQQ